MALFAGMAAAAGTRTLAFAWPGGTVADLRRAIAERCPAVVPLLARSAIAVGGRYAPDESPAGPGDDIAVVPPVSGG